MACGEWKSLPPGTWAGMMARPGGAVSSPGRQEESDHAPRTLRPGLRARQALRPTPGAPPLPDLAPQPLPSGHGPRGMNKKELSERDICSKFITLAKIRVLVKRILGKYGHPPDKQEAATKTVLEQAELLCAEWAA